MRYVYHAKQTSLEASSLSAAFARASSAAACSFRRTSWSVYAVSWSRTRPASSSDRLVADFCSSSFDSN